MELNFKKPSFLNGGISVDDRGSLTYLNAFPISKFKRFYIVHNFSSNFVRAWHGHRHEAKAVICLSGAAVVGAVEVDNWETPSKDLPIDRFILSKEIPGVLYIPPGYANGFMSLTSDTKLMFFSSSTLEESKLDDFRYDATIWDCWKVIER